MTTDISIVPTGNPDADRAVARAREALAGLGTGLPAQLTWVGRAGGYYIVMFEDGTPDLPFWVVPDDPYLPVESVKVPAEEWRRAATVCVAVG